MDYVKDFYQFLNEVKARRAWSGKIENLDRLMTWMYDKDILNKGEKARKDSIFHQYYSYYNNGDFPKGLLTRGINRSSSTKVIEDALEQMLEDFLKTILLKYSGKFNRTNFRYDMLLDDLHFLKSVIDENEFYSLIKYWSKKITVGNSEFEDLLAKADTMFNKLKDDISKEIKAHDWGTIPSWDRPSAGPATKYQRDEMKKADCWTPDLEKLYQDLSDVFIKMSAIISTVIDATQQLKDISNKV